MGHGRSGTVYLARHIGLDEYRAVKQVPKTRADYSRFRKEALLLKTIRHPGIPVVYDLEEDEDYSYLIEEFLEGDSLYALVSDMGHFSKAMTVRYGIQICRLVNILHSARPNPILYLDLQPKNLLICHDTVKLVDFDHAVHLDEAKHLLMRYGTVGCAAPEQYTKDVLDERTDIYAIGAVLYYMLTGEFPSEAPAYPRERIDREMARVIRVCLQRDRTRRYASAQELCRALERIQKNTERGRRRVFDTDGTLSLTIAVAGARHGAGATHIAMGLCAYLRRRGYPALYEEKNSSRAVLQYASYAGAEMDRCGIFRIGGLPMLPSYGAAAGFLPHPYRITVWDCGDDVTMLSEQADACLLVCGSKPWEWETNRELLSRLAVQAGLAVIYNHFCGQEKLPGPAGETPCFLMPYHPDPLKADRAADAVYEAVCFALFGGQTGGILRGLLRKGTAFLRGLPAGHRGEPSG